MARSGTGLRSAQPIVQIGDRSSIGKERDRGTRSGTRGANGIDGQLSTFFGQCEAGRENVCVVGDLTALYDLNAPWVVSQLEEVAWRIVIVNNGGGRIFSRVASLRSMDAAMRERIIENSHAVRFADWAAMWNIVEHVTELLPDAESSRRLWQKYDEL
ncbi:MAG TPA: hypothetical protein VGF48_11120, partial [Thermoanaerobaculia bacterium]